MIPAVIVWRGEFLISLVCVFALGLVLGWKARGTR